MPCAEYSFSSVRYLKASPNKANGLVVFEGSPVLYNMPLLGLWRLITIYTMTTLQVIRRFLKFEYLMTGIV